MSLDALGRNGLDPFEASKAHNTEEGLWPVLAKINDGYDEKEGSTRVRCDKRRGDRQKPKTANVVKRGKERVTA